MVHRITQVESWLQDLGLYGLSQEEMRYLVNPGTRDERCQVLDDLVFICHQRYRDNSFWPDFSVLNLPCALPKKRRKYRPRVFAIGL